MRLILLVMSVMLWCGLAQGAPFAKSNQMTDIVSWEFSLNDGPDEPRAPTAEGAGSVGYYDLAGLSGTGSHVIKVRACNSWGCGPYSANYSFITVAPGTPTIMIVPVMQ